MWSDLRTVFKKAEKTSTSSTTNVKNYQRAIVEATGWVRDKQGELYLVARNQTGIDTNHQILNCRGV